MDTEAPSTVTTRDVVLQLLDPMRGHAIQTWQFSNRSLIRIGRADDNDVTLGDPQVSRYHAELHLRGSAWELVSKGRHGTFVADESVEQSSLQEGTVLQLGPTGPKLRFHHALPVREDETMVMRPMPAISEMLQVDQQQTEEQVREIVDTPSFRRAQDLARKLRGDDSSSDDPSSDDPTTGF